MAVSVFMEAICGKRISAMNRTWFVILILLLWAATTVVQAQYTYTNADGGIYAYSTNSDGSANIAGYTGPPWVVIIPTNINGLTVTSIGNNAFVRHIGLTSMTIPESVATIGQDAFGSCASLTNVTILAGGLTNIGAQAFTNCINLNQLTIANGVTSIGAGAFAGSGLTSVTIPGSVANVGSNAFLDCRSLTNATINFGVTNLAVNAFANCTSLASVAMPASVTSIGGSAFYACIELTTITIPSSVTNMGGTVFWYCTNILGVYFAGNAPTVVGNICMHDSRVTVYCLPGTTGWTDFTSSTSVPVVLWNPQIQSSGPSFGIQGDQFGFNITGTPRIPIVVEGCGNLANPVWVPLHGMALTNGLVYFTDPQGTNFPGRFYRVSSP
jgi:hypothetical protein